MSTSGEITRIERQKSGAPRYNIHIDGTYRFAVHEDVLIKWSLAKGMIVDTEKMEGILQEEERNKVRQAALRYVGYKPRTLYETKRHLISKGFAEEHITHVIADMETKGYLDDRRYAGNWVEERRRTKGYGVAVLRQELLQKGVSSTVVEEAISHVKEEDEATIAMATAEKRYRRLSLHPWKVVERRLGQYLLRRGFHSSLVRRLLLDFKRRHQEGE
ncbi:RecX family transcriptional regulator [Marininema halotolerans]|uniref:Regulatory protein RecX n=1 Tax=Marininema halotolerans TaxID=1155944 RepID=A0A1I6R622_9BACL|nr:RecX family transcriptional regulator [Marininema halotolerans]SFS60162.1 regulatory protein [Marininema halotolerans]